jgi:tetratricopeptide (TPR) repeat protein
LRNALLLFVLFFPAYLFSSSGVLPPYRDAGEMVVSASTLGVSHPPGYPLYILLGRAAASVPLGTEATKLNALSAAAGAGAVAALAWAVAPAAGVWSAAGAALLGLDPTFWHVSQVPEMYSLGLLLAAICLGLALRLRRDWSERRLALLALLYGLSLGVRLDLALLAPVFLLPFRSLDEAATRRPAIVRALGYFLLGFAVYLYLPLRARTAPWLDWYDPSTPGRFLGALTRQSYGGTLDLLSRQYAAGRNFDANLRAWLLHLWSAFGPLSAACAAGLWALGGPGPAVGAAVAGPVFLFLSNLPPNPHAMAIVEPHYLTADLLLAAAASAGLAAAARRWSPRIVAAAALAALAVTGVRRCADSDRRWELLALDWADSALRAAPPGGRVVAKKDVQLFALWHAKEALGRRPDTVVIAQGLSGSDWYQAGMRHEAPGLRLLRLGTPENWKPFLDANGPALATMDADWPPGLPSAARGLSVLLSTAASRPDARPWMELVCLRGPLEYEAQKDFFSSDLDADYSAAWHRSGAEALRAGAADEAYRRFALAWAAKTDSPEPPLYMGLIRFQQGRAEEAERLFSSSTRLFDEELALADRYRALPGVTGSLRKGGAAALLNWGAAEERLGRKERALEHYEKAAAFDPSLAQVHYNIAVLFWERDWGRVRRELEETLRLDPRHPEAGRYLARLPK